jgi:peptide/nickel transport system substrate-binding protein
MRSYRVVCVFAVVVLLSSVLAGCGTTPEPAAPQTAVPSVAVPATEPAAEPTAAPEAATAGGTLVVGLSWEPSKIDPHRTAADNGLLPVSLACETLVLLQNDDSFEPGLATSWEISPDGTSYTFQLRQGVRFQDGSSFDAEAVKYNLERIVDPNTQSEQAKDKLGPFDSVEVIDPSTVTIHLTKPYAAFLDAISGTELCMVSPTAAKQWGPDEFQDHFVATGPFILKEWKRGEQILLERNPDYWGGPETAAHQGLAYLDAVVFKFLSEDSVRSGTLETGEIQVAQDVATLDVARLEQDPSLTVVIKPSPGQPVIIYYNMSKSPLDDIKVRQAFSYAIDQKAISDTLYEGILGPAYGPFSPTTPCYWSGAEQMYPPDPEKAKALLEEAGWKDENGDGIREKDGQPLRVDFPTHSGLPMYNNPSEIVQAQLKEVGVDVNIQPVSGAAWLEAGASGNNNLSIMDWRVTDPDFSRFTYSSGGYFAWYKAQNPTLDDLIAKGSVTVDPTERCGYYVEAQKILMNDAMVKPINLSSAIWGVRGEVQDFQVHDLRTGFFSAFDVWLSR